MIQLYNSETHTKTPLEPIEEGVVRLYTCGPTVYNYATIGNFRSFLFEDVLKRYLRYRGLTVKHVMNITDVGHMLHDADTGEDKLEVAARKEKKDPWEIARFYEEAFLEDAEALRIDSADHYPRATEHVEAMIGIIEKLLENGHAYESNGCLYYDVESFPEYGRLSGNTLDDLTAGARVEVNPDKRNPLDFALWIQDENHIMQWDSPWGRGYPGWHVECSAMAMQYLGPTLDIHCGGEDNIFPHHDCEIAQSEGATGQPFCKIWMHARFLLVDGKKMSKSLGNFYTLRDLLDLRHDPVAIRYALISTHYRQPLNFTLDGIGAAHEAVKRLRDCARRLQDAADGPVAGAGDAAIDAILAEAQRDFEAAMDDDLNMSAATAAIFVLVRELNKLELGSVAAARALDLLTRFDSVLDVIEGEDAASADVDADEIEGLIAERAQARIDGDYARADAIRDDLLARGIQLEDGAGGTTWKAV